MWYATGRNIGSEGVQNATPGPATVQEKRAHGGDLPLTFSGSMSDTGRRRGYRGGAGTDE
jgi:hypothetical protein